LRYLRYGTDRKERDHEKEPGPVDELVFCYQDKARVRDPRIR